MAISLPDNEAGRLAALHEYHILDTPPEEELEDLVRLAAHVCSVPIAAISLIDEHRQWFKAIIGLDVTETPREAAFCAHTILQQNPLIVLDTQVDPRFADNPLVTGETNIRFYAGVPLITEDGYALGTLCVLDKTPRQLTPEQEQTLRLLARQVSSQLKAARRVAERERIVAEREQAEEALRQSNHALQEAAARLVEAQRIGKIGDWVLDIMTGCFTWSLEVFRLMEFNPAEGEPHFEVVQSRYHPDDKVERDRLFAWALDTGESYQCDIRLLLPSGTPRSCHLVGRPETDGSGRVAKMKGTAMDITERVEREQQVLDANLILTVQKAQLEAANARLEALAMTDPLTGLLNHRTFQIRLTEETSRVQRQGTALAVVMLDLDNFKFFNDVYGHAAGDEVLVLVANRLQEVCRPSDTLARFGGDEFILILPDVGHATAEEVELRLCADLKSLSYSTNDNMENIPISISFGTALFPEASTDCREVLRQADERLRWAMTGGQSEEAARLVRIDAVARVQGFSMLDALVTAVDNKDRYTRKHSEDVMEYSLMIVREMGIDEGDQHTVAVAALLHDLGKIGTPDHILRKPGKLTEAEFDAVKQHPTIGAIIVAAVPGLEDTLDAVRHHHERWDGDGYPFGLQGEDTPIIARLMSVADAYSAMTTDRPYRKGMEQRKALSILEAGAGTQWDPACVAAFIKVLLRSQSLAIVA